MEHQYSEDDLMGIAKQLGNPKGEHGIKTGEAMNINNIGMTNSAIDAMELTDGDYILEIGHGNGGHLAHLLSQAENLKYQGADISETIIDEAKKLNADFLKNGSVHFQLTDGKTFPFADEEFDKIFTVNTIYFWENPIDYLTEIRNILIENGRLIIGFADRSFMEKLPFTKYGFKLYNIETVMELLQKAGFNNVHFEKKSEQINSNAGFMVDRDYYVVVATA